MKPKRLVLVHGKYFNSWEALGLAYIGAYVKKYRPDIEITFFQGCFDTHTAIVNGSIGADWVMFSCTTPSFPHALHLIREIKHYTPNTVTVVGGYHPSAVVSYEAVPQGVDYFVVGEGESAALKIINDETTEAERKHRSVFGSMMNLHELPWPDRELVKNERNILVAQRETGKRITSFQGHRACPFQCAYCLDGAMKALYPGKTKSKELVRYRDVEDLVKEIDHYTRVFGLDLVKFSDPTWNTSVEWVEDFCAAKQWYGVEVPFYPNLHAGLITERMAHAMKNAQCYEVAIGIESGSPKVLKQIGKGTSVKSIKRGVQFMKDADVIVRGYFILGMPDETEDDIRMTEELAAELDLDEYGFTILCPYPGTAMYDHARFKGVDWENADEYSNDFWRSKHLSNQQLRNAQERLTKRFSDKITWHNKVIANDAGV